VSPARDAATTAPEAVAGGTESGPVRHADHVRLLRDGVPRRGGVWADLGSGEGAFTLALAELIGPSGEIYSVDLDASALQRQERAMRARFPEVPVHYLQADFTRSPELPRLDGLIMANSLHFRREKRDVLRFVRDRLKSDGRFLLVEYDTDSGNEWVPYPLSYRSWERLAQAAGFSRTRLLATAEGRFLNGFYSAESLPDP
jgi:SAM-dependent methyltransferase